MHGCQTHLGRLSGYDEGWYCAGDSKLGCCLCEHKWCAKCNVAWHVAKSCEEMRQELSAVPADAAFNKYMQETKTVQCPGCTRAVQKTDGRNRIQ